MDASNPVADSTRITISSMRERKQRTQRQDLGWLDRICANLTRTVFPTANKLDGEEERVRVVKTRLAKITSEKQEKLKEGMEYNFLEREELSKFLTPLDPVPVCGLMADGVPIHPSGKNQQAGKVSQNLNFGNIGICKMTTELAAMYTETTVLQELLDGLPIYTMGTPKGLRVRLEKQLSTKTVKPSINFNQFLNIVNRALPLNNNPLMNWHDNLYDLFENVKTSYVSSAGCPYWRTKEAAIDDMLDLVLPMVAEALCQGTLDKLYKEQPELFLCAIKNKDDRYVDPCEKTRPYLSLPWHWQTLFSVLSQGFCSKLKQFHEQKGCRNAYGFSYANGGGNKLIEFARATKPGEPSYCVYGDDVDFYFRDKEGVLYRVCPDFSQMDGSVDEKTVSLVIDWIYHTYAKEFGENQFWKNVCQVWKQMAVDPSFVVLGTAVYKKKSPNGIMSGVVGTTLFDTVKAILAYEDLVDTYPHATSLLNEELIVKFFKERGLTIKAGTWDPTPIADYTPYGEYVSDQKFLGMKLRCVDYNGKSLYVPTLDYKDWLALLITPKDRKSHSSTQKYRYLFDRLRGLLTTGGVFDDEFMRLCNSMLMHIPPSAIVMQVQVNNGKGENPELVKVCGDDFTYTDSSTFPTVDWALDLYSPEEWKTGAQMQKIFEDPEGLLANLPKPRMLQPKAVVVDVKSGPEIFASTVVPLSESKEPAVVPDFEGKTTLATPTTVPKMGSDKFDKKSLVRNYFPSTGEILDSVKVKDAKNKIVEEPLKMPTLEKQIIGFMGPVVLDKNVSIDDMYEDFVGHMVRVRERSGVDGLKQILNSNHFPLIEQTIIALASEGHTIDVLEKWTICLRQFIAVESLAIRLGQTPKLVSRLCRQLGYYVFGPPEYEYVTSVPVAPMNVKYKDQIAKQEIENVERLKEVTEKAKVISEDTPTVLENKKVLTDVVTRAAEPPAQLPVHNISREVAAPMEQTFVLKKVANASLEGVPSMMKKEKEILVSKILRGNLIFYNIVREKEGDTIVSHFYWKRGDEEQLVYKTINKNYIVYYDWVIAKYKHDITMNDEKLSAANTPWFDLYSLHKNVRVRLYKEQGVPLMLYMNKKSPVLLREHPNLVVERGQLIVKSGDKIGPINIQKMEDSANRLTGILGSNVEVENITYNDFKAHYSQFDDQLGVTEYLKELSFKDQENKLKVKIRSENAKKRREKREGLSSSRNSEAAEARRSPQRESSKSKSERSQSRAKSAKAEVEHEKTSNESRNNGRLRLSRDSSHISQDYDRRGGFYNQYMPYGLGWYPHPAGSNFMAALPPQVSGPRNYNFGPQNDGWPVYGRMDRRRRGPHPHKRGRGPF